MGEEMYRVTVSTFDGRDIAMEYFSSEKAATDFADGFAGEEQAAVVKAAGGAVTVCVEAFREHTWVPTCRRASVSD